ncbi:MAG: response regulator [Sorangiineae bacterium]|nr:response regulator [Sorangiineae bacterium]
MTELDEPSPRLHVMAIVEDGAIGELILRILASGGDEVTLATDLAEGLARAAAEAPDVVIVDVTVGSRAGLAVVHHLHALAPNVRVYALVPPEAPDVAVQAIALGAAGFLMTPLSGDELLVALSDARTRQAELATRRALERQASRALREAELVGQVARLAECASSREAAEGLLALLEERVGISTSLLYLGAGAGSRQLFRASMRGVAHEPPTFCDDLELMRWAAEHELEVFRLTAQHEHVGLLVADERAGALSSPEVVTLHAATVLALLMEREQSKHGVMKDPNSSAYTFAYFVDVAGREIDQSRRHGRRFSLATITVEPGEAGEAGAARRASGVEAVERVLTAVRDTDILARVDEAEFYLLMPETGGIGAHACRRRIIDALEGPLGSRRGARTGHRVSIGAATYPHDGADLSSLLAVARHRAERSAESLVRRLRIEASSLAELVDALFWDASDLHGHASSACACRLIELPLVDLADLAVVALGEARRGGGARVVATQHAGLSIGNALRAALGRDRDAVEFDVVDVTDLPGCGDLEALTIVAEHGVYALFGRVEHGVVRAVHAGDPLLVDLMLQRLGDATGVRLLD